MRRSADRPRRVLHILRAMNRAGIETWLMESVRRFDRRRVHLDFLLHTAARCTFDDEIESRGCRILRVTEPLYSPAYALRVLRLLRAGAYDAVHSHVHYFSGYLVLLARLAGIPSRISHSHTDSSLPDRQAGLARRCYTRIMQGLIRANSTGMIAASGRAAAALFGAKCAFDPRVRTLYCGIDLEPFREKPNRRNVRSEWRFSPSDFVIGHVGRFDAAKNQSFVVETAAEAIRADSRVRLLMVGDGPLREMVERRASELGVAERVSFAGVRRDVPALMAAMDVFIFPSRLEGLGLSVVEAQAAGLPCFISEAIPPEADVNPSLICRLPLSAGPRVWAETMLSQRDRRPDRSVYVKAIEGGVFDISRSVEELYALYDA